MGVLTIGKPLTWNDIQGNLKWHKQQYLHSFINNYLSYQSNTSSGEHFGDELEYNIFTINTSNNRAKISSNMMGLLDKINSDVELPRTDWPPEYGDCMIAGVPKFPFEHLLDGIYHLEGNLSNRRRELLSHLDLNEICPTLSIVPNLCNNIVNETTAISKNPITNSKYVTDSIIYPHVRFHTLTKNIREKRGNKVDIPIYIEQDANTKRKIINGDAMGFGMGCCCLQVTLEARDLNESLLLFDILQPLSPIMLAISAASPIAMGYLKNGNTRWDIVADSVADHGVLGRQKPVSRYDMCHCYLHPDNLKYNNKAIPIEKQMYATLLENKVPSNIATYISQILNFDPVLIFSNDTHEFKSHQSTVWQNVRWKIPTNREDSWRVEFRTMEIQLTDFENTAMILFTVLYARACQAYQINPCFDITKNNINMRFANRCENLSATMFWWKDQNGDVKLTEIETIITEILDLIYRYLHEFYPSLNTILVDPYLNLVFARACGKVPTCAEWIRNYVKHHQEYRGDSVVNKRIIYDLVNTCHTIGMKNSY